MDRRVIWQSETEEIFKTEYKEAPEKMFGSLTEYASTFGNSGVDD